MSSINLYTDDLIAIQPSVQDVLIAQQLIPDECYETILPKLPKKLPFVYMPYHPYFFSYWETLTRACMTPITTPDGLQAVFTALHGQNSSLFSNFSSYLNQMNDRDITPNGLTAAQTFWSISLPTIQRAILTLPLEMRAGCNWGDFTVMPTLTDVANEPNDAVHEFVLDTQPQQTLESPQALVKSGFTIAQFVAELDRVVKAEGTQETTPAPSTFAPDVQTAAAPQQMQDDDNDAAQGDTAVTQTNGFFFGPGMTKLILPRKAVMGLMAVGFFGLPALTQSKRSVEFTYPFPHHTTGQTITRNYPLTCGTFETGIAAEMYRCLPRSSAVMGKLQAMLSYFFYFVDKQVLSAASSPHQLTNYVTQSYNTNVIGCVEYCWKLPAIQVDYVIDTLLNRSVFRNDKITTTQPSSTSPSLKSALTLDQLNFLNTPPTLMPTGTRRGLYLSHPRLVSLNEFVTAFDSNIRSTQSTTTPTYSIDQIDAAYNAIYAPQRYPLEATKGDITSVEDNYYRRWLYGQDAMAAMYLILTTNSRLLTPTFIGGTPMKANATYSNTAAMQMDTLRQLSETFKAQQWDGPEEGVNNTTGVDLATLSTILERLTRLGQTEIKNELFPLLEGTLDRIISRTEAVNGGTVSNDDFAYLNWDQTYGPKPFAANPSLGSVNSSAPERFRIQSFHHKFLNNSILADFANKHLGGGTLHSGSVQEEQLFSEYFECCLPMGFSSVMHPSATITITGVVNHAILGGYGSRTFLSQYMTMDENLWVNNQATNTIPTSIFTDHTDKFPVSSILAYDSTPYAQPSQQFQLSELKRQLTKLTSGLTSTKSYFPSSSSSSSSQQHDERLYTPTTFITGNWGCGVFGATPAWIYLLQLVTTSAMDISLRYLSVADPRCLGAHLISLVLHLYGTQQGALTVVFDKMLALCRLDVAAFLGTSNGQPTPLALNHTRATKIVQEYKSSPAGRSSIRLVVAYKTILNKLWLAQQTDPASSFSTTVQLSKDFSKAGPVATWDYIFQHVFAEAVAALDQHK